MLTRATKYKASYIQDYRQSKAFLAGPGPMQSTASDFWTMIWEKKSHAIVMLGQLKENGDVCELIYEGRVILGCFIRRCASSTGQMKTRLLSLVSS